MKTIEKSKASNNTPPSWFESLNPEVHAILNGKNTKFPTDKNDQIKHGLKNLFSKYNELLNKKMSFSSKLSCQCLWQINQPN